MILRLVLVLALLSGCAGAATPLDTDDITLASALTPFDDCEALTGRIQEHALEQIEAQGMVIPGMGAADGAARAAAEDTASLQAAPQAEAGRSGTFSTTNVQEAGVDEADLAKTDGEWLYTIPDGTTVRVVDVRRDQPTLAATVRLGRAAAARELLLLDDRLLVIGDTFEPARMPVDPAASSGSDVLVDPEVGAGASVDSRMIMAPSQTRLWLIDVADPTQPEILSTMTLDGWTVASRLTDQTARVVLRSALTPPPLEMPKDGSAREQRRAADANREHIRNSDAQDWLPRVQVDEAGAQTLADCREVYEPRGFTDLGLVTVVSLDMTAGALDADRVEAVLGAADAVYANEDRLYVTTSRWPAAIPGMPLPVEPLPMPRAAVPDTQAAPVEPAPPADVPSATAETPPPVEKPSAPVEPPSAVPSAGVVEPAPPTEPAPTDGAFAEPIPPPEPQSVTTEVHRFDLVEDGARYAVSGSVPGRLLNQWAMSEHDGDLRIATTEGGFPGDTRTHSSVRILRERGDRLRTIGHIDDLGRGEEIYAVRYVGDIGFVVTFRQVDPLYTLDLSDPRDPRLLGELKVPGYSSYLHPVDDDHLLGVGQNADADGRTTGVQVSLFDVADLTQPARVAHAALGRNTMTDVEYDHRAFLYWPQERMAVLPLAGWEPDGRIGAVVLGVDPGEGVVERGFIEHAAHEGMPPPVQRAFVVNDRIITVTYAGVLASDLTTLEPLGEAGFVR
ncbi:MAG TPA: beta-propeller domain-containing protein [Euzebyales bacterium]|nr:beta-propeller domain-containing protein [Euzebyales bacterium]